MVLLLLLPMTLVFTFYFSRNIDFWIVQSVCIWILMAWAMHHLQTRRLLAMLFAGLLLINLFGTMQFVRSADRDFHQWRAAALVEELQDDDLVIIGDPWPTASFIEYLGETKPLSLVENYQSEMDPEVIENLVDQTLAEGRRVVLYDDVFSVGAKSALFYGPGYVDYAHRFIRDLPPSTLISRDAGRRHRLIQPLIRRVSFSSFGTRFTSSAQSDRHYNECVVQWSTVRSTTLIAGVIRPSTGVSHATQYLLHHWCHRRDRRHPQPGRHRLEHCRSRVCRASLAHRHVQYDDRHPRPDRSTDHRASSTSVE